MMSFLCLFYHSADLIQTKPSDPLFALYDSKNHRWLKHREKYVYNSSLSLSVVIPLYDMTQYNTLQLLTD